MCAEWQILHCLLWCLAQGPFLGLECHSRSRNMLLLQPAMCKYSVMVLQDYSLSSFCLHWDNPLLRHNHQIVVVDFTSRTGRMVPWFLPHLLLFTVCNKNWGGAWGWAKLALHNVILPQSDWAQYNTYTCTWLSNLTWMFLMTAAVVHEGGEGGEERERVVWHEHLTRT